MQHDLFFVILLLASNLNFASMQLVTVNQKPEAVLDTSSEQEMQKFSPQQIEIYKKSGNFDFLEPKIQEKGNLDPLGRWLGQKLIQLREWLNQRLAQFLRWVFGSETAKKLFNFLSPFWQYATILLVTAALVLFFLRVNPFKISFATPKPNQVILTEEEDLIKNQDLQSLIDQSLANNNYRLAIRYVYLKTLKELSSTNHIDWQVQKTNAEYTREISNITLSQSFHSITKWYDFAWYGNFPVDKQSYAQVQSCFLSIMHAIS